MKRYTNFIALTALAMTVSACSTTSTDDVNTVSTKEVKTLQFKGSDVQVSWDRTAKTKATLTYNDELSIWSNDAEKLISRATGCKADSGVMHYPKARKGFQAITMPITCQ
ncbi:hypothetical protein DK867_22010 [Ochrobactrum sp. POC9]|uniref:hypothetical protein n=1 Tax=Ochrobactrum sp. POC9 TaxID=2203419 RepID=UPI000D705A27|nr:hypothetical protein [Ochrobactrum sp. POC9]PWU70969.1 hypothetical protein DK867_22010 [Ochrobactrum sp. POC9]